MDSGLALQPATQVTSNAPASVRKAARGEPRPATPRCLPPARRPLSNALGMDSPLSGSQLPGRTTRNSGYYLSYTQRLQYTFHVIFDMYRCRYSGRSPWQFAGHAATGVVAPPDPLPWRPAAQANNVPERGPDCAGGVGALSVRRRARGGGAASPAAVFERGSPVPIPFAALTCRAGCAADADAEGRFTLEVPPGTAELTITAPGYEPLHLVETLPPTSRAPSSTACSRCPRRATATDSTVRGEARHEGERFTLQGRGAAARSRRRSAIPSASSACCPASPRPCRCCRIYVVRGASPGMNGFFLDGMRVPQLFHFSSAAASCTRASSIASTSTPAPTTPASAATPAASSTPRPAPRAPTRRRTARSSCGSTTPPRSSSCALPGNVGPDAAEERRGWLPAGDHELRRRRQVLDQRGEEVERLGRPDLLDVVEHDDERLLLRARSADRTRAAALRPFRASPPSSAASDATSSAGKTRDSSSPRSNRSHLNSRVSRRAHCASTVVFP